MSKQSDKGTIGFCSVVSQEMANRRMEGVLRYLQDTPGLRLRDFRVFGGLETDDQAPPPPWTGKAEGVIMCFGMTGEKSDEVYRWLQRGEAPVVSLVREWVHPRIPVVCTDSDAVMQLAADYLVDKGHRHFAFVADSVNLKDTARRREVFQRRLKDHSYRALGCDLAFRPGDDIASLERAQHDAGLIRFLRNAPKPLGVFALTDHYARALCMLCEKLGLDVPNEVAILGSGNLIASRSGSPTLSSVETGNDEIGYEAMKMLHHLMHGGRGSRRPKMIPPVQVIERESSCPGFTSFGSAQRAREFIRAHACEGIRVADVVRALSISRRTLENHFRQSVGHSPGEEIALVRLERAKELLTETDLSMTHVSGMAGFNEPPRFSTFFRRHVGLSPSEYRQRWQEGNLRGLRVV